MQNMQRWSLLILLTVVTLSAGCTSSYKPVSEWEQRVREASTIDVYPGDVRSDLEGYRSRQVAWAGVITRVSIDETAQPPLMHLDLDHKFFSWAEDATTRQFWLSPRGEGTFSTSWPMQEGWDLDEMLRLIETADMMIAYGTAKSVSADGRIQLGQAAYVRHIPKAGFRMDRIEYGRPGEPTKILHAP